MLNLRLHRTGTPSAQPQEAIPKLDAAIESDPNNALAYQRRATANEFSGNDQAAVKDLNQAILLFQSSGNTYNRNIVAEA